MPTRDEIQADAVNAIVAMRQDGKKSTLFQMPTQTGKTRTACKYIGHALREWNGRVLVCAHMGELLDQWARELDAMGIKYCVEKSSQKAYEWMRIDPLFRVCLGSKDTLQNRGKTQRLASWPKDFFSDILEDECHLATAKTWGNVHDHFGTAFRVGMTATIDRLDGVPLCQVFDSTAYTYQIGDAIKNGHRVPFVVVPIDMYIDIRGVKANAKGEFNAGKLEQLLGPQLESIANVVRIRFEELQTRGVKKGIVFFPTVPLAKLFAEMLTKVGLHAKSVHGSDPARSQKIKEHKEGEFPLLVNKKLLGMGYNDPGIGAVFDFDPTTSRSWLDQKAGRCGATAEGKTAGYLLYPDWDADPDLMGPTDIFAVNESARVRKEARRLARTAKDTDPEELIERARENVQEEDRMRAIADRKSQYEAKRRDVRHRFREFDPIGVRRPGAAQLADTLHSSGPVDPELVSRLTKLGVRDTRGLSNEGMREMVRLWEDRYACGMSTYGQFAYLVNKRQFPPSDVMRMTNREAQRVIGQLHSMRA